MPFSFKEKVQVGLARKMNSAVVTVATIVSALERLWLRWLSSNRRLGGLNESAIVTLGKTLHQLLPRINAGGCLSEILVKSCDMGT